MTLSATRRLLERGVADGLHRGGQLYVARGGAIEADVGFGLARPDEPMRRDHLMLWLSAGKPVTAVAIGQLWERGQLDVEDPVSHHLPEFSGGGKKGVTLRHLLTHTGGIRAVGLGWPDASWEEIVARICSMRLEPRWVPGRRAGYHLTSSWFLLGEIVQRLSGVPFSDYVRREIFEPLGMDDCWIGMTRRRFAELARRIAPVYDSDSSGEELDWTDECHLTRPSPGGNAVGPMHQLGRFYTALLAGGRLDGGKILERPTVAALTARHRVGLWDRTFRHRLDWGLGFIPNSAYHGEKTAPYGYGPHASLRAYGHSGYRSTVAFADPDFDLVVCLAVNGTPSAGAHRRRFHAATAAVYEELGLAGGAG